MTEEADPVFTLQHNMGTSGLWDTEGAPVSPIQAGKKIEQAGAELCQAQISLSWHSLVAS